MEHLGDITNIRGCVILPVDVAVGGSPCQDLSVAGKRAGLSGERSGLYIEQIRIIKELRYADSLRGRTDQLIRPRYMVWENVPGAFSSNQGEDFRVVLEEAARISEPGTVIPGPPGGKWRNAGCILGDGWSIAWRVLDAQFWGVPQRRRRIALVADFGGHAAPEVLFVRKGVCGDTQPGEAAGEGPAGGAGGGANPPIARSLTARNDGSPCVDRGPNIVMQTAAFMGGQGAKARSIGYTVEAAPTLKSAPSGGNTVPCVYENHGQDSRLTGPLDIAPTVARKFGTGGNNTPLVMATGQGGSEVLADQSGMLALGEGGG